MRVPDILMAAIILFASASAACALEAAVKDHLGSPTILVNGKPTVPLVFYGWAGTPAPPSVTIGPEWQHFVYTFIAPEDNAGQAGVQFRVGGGPPGTVWLDDVWLYPGEPQHDPPENMLRHLRGYLPETNGTALASPVYELDPPQTVPVIRDAGHTLLRGVRGNLP